MPWKKYSEVPSTSIPVNGLALSQVTQHWQLQFPTNSRSKSHSQSAQQTQRSQPICPWSAHTPPSVQWPSPFPRHSHAPSTTATAGGELFLFGGNAHGRICNDLYVISTQDFSTSLLQASGDVPDPRYGHRAMFTSTSFLIWGGARNVSDQIKQNQVHDDSLYLLNLGTSNFRCQDPLQLMMLISTSFRFQYHESGPASSLMVPGLAAVTTIP